MPDERTLIALADALDVSTHYLLRQPMVGGIRLLFACRIDEHDPDQWYPCALKHHGC